MKISLLEKHNKSVMWLLLVQLILLYCPILQLFSIQTDNGPIPASLCYFYSLVFVPYLLRRLRGLRLPPWWLTGLILYVWGLALLRISQYGLSKSILHWVFGAYLLVVILNVGTDLEKEEWAFVLETAACIFAISHFVLMCLNYKTVLWLENGYFSGTLFSTSGCYLPSLTRGGRNLDCTWMALGGFFVRGRKKVMYVTYLIIFIFLGGSRAGLLTGAVLILWSLVYDPIYRLTKRAMKWYLLYAICMLAVLFCSGLGQAFLNRNMLLTPAPGKWIEMFEEWQGNAPVLSATGVEDNADLSRKPDVLTSAPSVPNITTSGSGKTNVPHEVVLPPIITPVLDAEILLSGRGAIWARVPQMFHDNPWGYGVGNAMRVMKNSYGFPHYEDIVHNVFFQWLLDEGFIGGLWYIGLGLAFLLRQWRQRPRFFATPFDGYFAAYLLVSLVQFHGGEALMIYVLGVFLLKTQIKHCLCLPWGKRDTEGL